MPPTLSLDPVFEFKPILRGESISQDFCFVNPSSRVLAWRIALQEADSAFVLPALCHGELGPKEQLRLPILFSPLLAMEYSVDVSIVSDFGSYVVQLHGYGEQLTFAMAPSLDFGIVGVGMPEVKTFTIKSTCKLDARIKVVCDDAAMVLHESMYFFFP